MGYGESYGGGIVVTKDDTRLKNSHGIQILELSYTLRDDYCFEHERYKARV